MALTRKLLKSMGIDDDKIDQIIDAHTETTDALRADLGRYKADAEKLAEVQKQLDKATADLETAKDGGFKAKYDAEHAAFEEFKASQTAKETRVAKESAYRKLLETAGISKSAMDAVMKASSTDIDAIELDGDTVKDADKTTAAIKTAWSGFLTQTDVSGADTPTPPAQDAGGSGATPKSIPSIF